VSRVSTVVPCMSPSSSSSSPTLEEGPNRPRNFLVTDATKPYTFSYLQYGKPVSIIVHQTAEDETWPGGALWDIGVLLAHFLVALAGFQPATVSKGVKPPTRLLEAVPYIKGLTVLELGCGVGLTGIVAAAVLGTQLTILTDLEVVVEKVARPNLELNSAPGVSINKQNQHKLTSRLTKAGKRGRILALPLCWGNEQHADAVMDCLKKYTKLEKASHRRKGDPPPNATGQPNLIIIGDVAYQHKPGAPSHFDALLSTVLKFMGPHTLVIFGTRMR
jgi:predicted nicotinamide N-methyase